VTLAFVLLVLISLNSIAVFAEGETTVVDCFKFSCPTIPGSIYPKDCLATVNVYTMRFDNFTQYHPTDSIQYNSTQYLRDMLDEYYSSSLSKCVKIEVIGFLFGAACSSADPSCVSTQEINVISLSVKSIEDICTYTSCISEGRTCTDSDGIDYMKKGTTIGIQDPTTGVIKTITDFCNPESEFKNWVNEYYCGIDEGSKGYVIGTSNKCPYGCEDGACLMTASLEITKCTETGSTINVEYSDGSTQILMDKCGYGSGSGEYGVLHYFCGMTSENKPHYWSSLTPCTIEKCGSCSTNITSNEAGVQTTIKTTMSVISSLETLKENIPEQAMEVTTVQDKILIVNTETDNFEQEINQRGFGYKFKWFFGMVAEQEKEDATFFKEQATKLTETSQLLLQISKQVEEPAKSVLVEQYINLEEQSKEFLQKAEDKEKNAKGLFGWFG